MAVLITGGGGFCGLNIAEDLLRRGQHVVLYGLEEPHPSITAAFASYPAMLSIELGDIRDSQQLIQSMRTHGVTQVVHGAAITAALDTERSKAHTILDVNLLGTLAVLEAAISCDIQRVVCLSSGAIFGSTVKTTGQLHEDVDIPVPESLYAISKYAAERCALRYRRTRNLDVVVLRLGVTFGRWEHDTGVRDTLSIPYTLWRLAEQGHQAAFTKQLPTDWVYGTDVAQAVTLLLAADHCQHSTYQVATGQSWAATDWCEALHRQFPNFRYEQVDQENKANVGIPAPTARPPFAIDRLKNEFGYSPRFLLPEAFADYAQWRQLFPWM
ncbi:NAD(P)-dependent oxidoreductase [Paenalcaligenes niemegkensis]|uniref:NAD-dependent epimerase/dehydratase family protein n=1 Tax=Paenalcaligenes niemegkensis TaxID=2895469 RepID=UPI001EE89666|nr:NAD(P)-dependent oxidoreductase [Paenalcaligenes niemegkensis]MCQ9617891.1 NAD(P)-dependent oxidoreductase [Paenalcaligenes niemegkensis]